MSPVVIEQVRAEESPDGKRARVDWSGADFDSDEAISDFGSDEDLAVVLIPARAAGPLSPITPPPGEFELAWKLSQRPYWPAGCHDNVEAARIFWVLKSCLVCIGCPFGIGIHMLSKQAHRIVLEELWAAQQRHPDFVPSTEIDDCEQPAHHSGRRFVPTTPPESPPRQLRLGEVDWTKLQHRRAQLSSEGGSLTVEQELEQMLGDGAQEVHRARNWEFWVNQASDEQRRQHVFVPRIQLQS